LQQAVEIDFNMSADNVGNQAPRISGMLAVLATTFSRDGCTSTTADLAGRYDAATAALERGASSCITRND
jgi:hypothetical protein